VAQPIFPGYSPEQIAVLNGLIPGGTGVSNAPGPVTTVVPARGFTPYQPPPIPAGYYDPSLDAQRDAASRGLTQTEQDIGLAGRRGAEDYGLNPNDPTYGYSTVGQINTQFGRQAQDLQTNRAYEGQDYGRNVAMLTRNYQQLSRQQAETARRYGVTSGGIALLSAAKRAENQGLEQQDLDTAHSRAVSGFDLAGTRLGEDKTNALGQAQTVYNRGVADQGTALSRARAEDLFYGLDVGAQKQYQASQAGYEAPLGPRNEFTSPSGQPYRTVKSGGYVISYDQNGREISRRKAS
jgi:hypothetical protein